MAVQRKSSELIKLFQPYDLVLFRGSELVSHVISYLEDLKTGSGDWTHVGIVVPSDCHSSLTKGRLYILESTFSGITVESKAVVGTSFGVQIRDLKDVCRTYQGKIGIGKLLKYPSDNLKLKEFVKRVIGVGYDFNVISLFSTIIPCLTEVRDLMIDPNERYFCSELITKLYVELGILVSLGVIKPENTTPMDLVRYPIFRRIICII